MQANITFTITIEEKEQAERYSKSKREILPRDYSEKKILAAKQHYFKAVETNEDLEIVDQNKRTIQNDIFEKMQPMKDMFIDLDEDEVDRVQDILEEESDEENFDDGEYPEDAFEWLFDSSTETIFPIPFTSKLEVDHVENTYDDDENHDQISADDMENSTLNFGEATAQQSCVNDDENHEQISTDNIKNGPSNVNDVENQQPYVDDDKNLDQSTVEEIENGSSNVIDVEDQESYVDGDENHEQTTVEEITTDATHVGVVKVEKNDATDQNNSETFTFFSPPSISSSSVSKVPNHFVRLDPNLHDFLSKRAKETKQSKAMAGQPQVTLDALLEDVKLIFPGQCTYVS